MRRAKQHRPLRPRNPVARSPLLGKGGAHGKSTGAKRRRAKVELLHGRAEADPEP